MIPSVIITGPHGCGKTRNARRLMNHLGLTLLYDGWGGGPFPAFNTLVLTNRADVPTARRYSDVMAEIEGVAKITTHRLEV